MIYEYRIPEFDNEWHEIEIDDEFYFPTPMARVETICEFMEGDEIVNNGGVARMDVRQAGKDDFQSFRIAAEMSPVFLASKYKEDA